MLIGLLSLQMVALHCPQTKSWRALFKYCPTFLGHDNEDYDEDDDEDLYDDDDGDDDDENQ